MKVRALKSFVGIGPDGNTYRASVGDVLDLPDGVDWLKAKLVEPALEEGGPETAALESGKTATRKAPRRKRKAKLE